MTGNASILHADLDSFYASVEQRDDPRLLGRPVIVGGGVVLSASYEARAHGVRTAMGGRRALALCPAAAVVRPRMSAYSAASKAVFAVFADTAPVVEALSIDEAFLDVRGLERISGTPHQIAARLRQDVRARVGLPITVGVARTKFLAKVASAVAKPEGLLVVEPDAELSFLHPLPIERLWGVGPATATKLRAHGLATVGDVADLSVTTLVALLGRARGRHLHALAHNDDSRPVRTRARSRSIGAQRALERGPHRRTDATAALLGLVDRVARRLRAANRVALTVQLRVRYADYSRATRSRTLPRATDETALIGRVAEQLLASTWPRVEARGLTLVGVALAGLVDRDARQLAFALDRRRELDATLDRVRDRFGSAALTRAVLVGRSHDDPVPVLEDR